MEYLDRLSLDSEFLRRSPFAYWQEVEVEFSATADQDTEILHQIPCQSPDHISWIVVNQSGPGVIYRGFGTLWGDRYIKLRSNVGGLHAVLLLFVTRTATGKILDYTPGSISQSGAVCWGYALPTNNETVKSWKDFIITPTGVAARVSGDADYGDLHVVDAEPVVSSVIDTNATELKKFVVTCPGYGTNTGTPVISIRGSSTLFSALDASPSWATYVSSFANTWRYVQLKIEVS